jgi:hypothetical protein
MDPNTIRDKFKSEVRPILARLQELRDDDERERDGLNRMVPPKQAQQERETLMRRFDTADAQAQHALAAVVAESAGRVADARSVAGDPQERTANLLEADQLARGGIDAQALAGRAAEALGRGDLRTAQVHLAAAKLAATNGQRVRGLDRLALDIQAALDDALPHRRQAIEAHRGVRLQYVEQTVERTKHRQLAALLVGDGRAAARASASAKVQAYDLAKAKGEGYEQEVILEAVGATTQINKPGA